MSFQNRIYLAGPIGGLTANEARKWRNDISAILPYGIECFSPMRNTENLNSVGIIDSSTEYKDVLCTSKAIMSRDFNDVKRADLIIVNFSGATLISIGTVMEVAWAWNMQKPVIAIAEQDNKHVTHLMMKEAISIVVDSVEAAAKAAVSFLKGEP